MPEILSAIRQLLRDNGIEFREIRHEPTRTSEESARARGEPLEVGGKAIVLKVDDSFKLFVLSAALGIDSGAIRRRFGAKKSRFATPEELDRLTGLVPGAVPPFGRPILDLDLHADPSIEAQDRIAFNAGSLTDSIVMAVTDYVATARPDVFPFSRAPTATS